MNLSSLKTKSTPELSAMAQDLGVGGAENMRRHSLMVAIMEEENGREKSLRGDGVIEVLSDGFGFLRTADTQYLPGTDDIYVSPSQIRRFGLHTGDTIVGVVRAPKDTERYFALLRVESINGRPSEQHRKLPSFRDLAITHAKTPISFAQSNHDAVGQIDASCPLGRGQRALLLGPSRAGKSAMLWEIGQNVAQQNELEVTYLFIDSRPEDVANIEGTQRGGTILASTSDEPPNRHVQLAEICIANAKQLAQSGGHSVVLLDSLENLTRAYASMGESEPAAISQAKVKRLFSSARALEDAGSLTLIATATTSLDTTQPWVDNWRSAANCEIWLDSNGKLDKEKSHNRRADLLRKRD